MSDIGREAHLRPSAAQLPVTAYFDPALHEREKKQLFARGPGYLGHQLMVPEPGDYYALPAEQEGRLLVHNAGAGADAVQLLSNVCRHRQAIMLNGRGNTETIVCPLHRWTYDLSGNLMGAPHFENQPCLNLGRSPLREWRGLLFEGPYDIGADLNQVECLKQIDFNGYRLDHVEIHECAYNWKTFIEVYLEDYHVEPFHPGLGSFVDCDDLKWQFGDWHSVQTVGVHRSLQHPGSPTYRRWHDELLRFGGGVIPPQGAIWLTCFPNVMVEWYPQVLVVSSLVPRGPRHTTNIVEFYYPQEVAWFERDLVDAQRACYMETALEDDEIALRMDAGRAALMARGIDQAGPYQSPMEDGMQHFHEYLRRELGTL